MKRYLLPLVAVLVMGAGCETADDDGSDVVDRDILGEGVRDTLDRDTVTWDTMQSQDVIPDAPPPQDVGEDTPLPEDVIETPDTLPLDHGGAETVEDTQAPDTLEQDTLSSDNGGGGGGCDQYCTDMIAACPEDDTMETCMSSCEHVEAGPSEAALECAAAATDCQSARPCWSAFFN